MISSHHIASQESYQDGEVIYKDGSSGDWVYVVQSGRVEISKTVNGKKFIIEAIEPGGIFGEVGFIADVGRIATACAVGQTTVGIVDKEFLDGEFNRLPEDFRAILVAVARRVKKISDRAVEFKVRKEPRLSKVLSVTFKVGDASVKGYLENISAGGLFIRTDRPLNPGHKFWLKPQLPGISEPLRLKCQVLWTREIAEGPTRPAGMGVGFRELGMRDYEVLRQFIEEQGTDEKLAKR